MNEDRDIVFRIDRKAGLLLLAALAVVFGGYALAEQLTLTTSYPVPSGIYNQLITTGNSGSVPVDTTFSRNAGNTVLVPPTNASGRVGIGTSAPSAAYKLDVNGNANVNGTLSSGLLVLNNANVANTACPAVGMASRDASGALLDCVGGIWQSVGTSGWPSGSYCIIEALGKTCPAGFNAVNPGVGVPPRGDEYESGLVDGAANSHQSWGTFAWGMKANSKPNQTVQSWAWCCK